MNEQIIAVDFDGTLCENKWPEIGEPNTNLIGYLIEMRKSFGAKIILWTCRVGEMLDKAVNWCSEHKGTLYDSNFVSYSISKVKGPDKPFYFYAFCDKIYL